MNAPSQVERGLWRSLPPALATEIGAVAVIAFDIRVGLIAGAVALVAGLLAVRAVGPPGTATLRALVLVAGPPLRLALLIAAAIVVWLPRAQGPLPALGCVFILGLVVPALAGGVNALAARLRLSPA